jgi:sortase A
VAPVVEGLSDAVLNVAVGHDPASPMPGDAGEAILEAHDVSYFSALDRLRRGEEVIWALGCRRWVFKTVSTTVADPGTLLPTPPSGFGLALVTCWPSNALWWTPDRFVVETTLSSVASAATPPGTPSVTPVDLVVPAPPALVRVGLGLEDNPVVLGTLRVEGSPTTAWRLGPGPLDAARVAVEDYFALRRTVESQDRLWWSKLALPDAPLPSAWSSSGVVDTIVHVRGESVEGVDLVSATQAVVLVVRGRDLFASRVTG